jgi:ribosome maturation protein Sdo1
MSDTQRVKLQLGGETFFVYAEPGKAEKYKQDPSMNLMDVVEMYDVFQVSQSADSQT